MRRPQLSSTGRVHPGMEAVASVSMAVELTGSKHEPVRRPANGGAPLIGRDMAHRDDPSRASTESNRCAIPSVVDDPNVELMLRVRDGDEDAFRSLVERHRRSVVRFLYRMVQHQAAAEELAQEVFLRVYRGRATYEPSAKFTTWLYRIATRLALNWIRDRKKEQGNVPLNGNGAQEAGEGSNSETVRQFADGAPTVEQDLLKACRAREIREAIGTLPENQRAAVLMHKYEGLGYAEIAVTLEVSESATKSLLFRAYQTLRVRLAHLAPREV